MTLHPSLVVVSGLIGTWRGEGRGEYPTISSFEYTEELTFLNVGKPFLAYSQRTWDPAGRPLHVETGYLRAPSYETLEFILAQPTGQTELAEGTLSIHENGFEAELRSRIHNSGTAKIVDETTRRIQLDGNQLHTDFAMAAVGVPMTHHLSSSLARVLVS